MAQPSPTPVKLLTAPPPITTLPIPITASDAQPRQSRHKRPLCCCGAKVGAASALLTEATDWALTYFDEEELNVMDEYAGLQPTALPIIYGARYCQHLPTAWHGVTWGLVEGFVKWLLNQGYSLVSVNNRLSAVKVYARLAAKAKAVPPPNMP